MGVSFRVLIFGEERGRVCDEWIYNSVTSSRTMSVWMTVVS